MAVVNVKPAAVGQNSFDYNPFTLASIDFAELVPVRVIESKLSDDWKKIKFNGFMRTAPSIFPAYGRANLNTAAFFVPEYQLNEASEAQHSNMNTFKGKAVSVPHILAYELNEMFFNNMSTPPDIYHLCYMVGHTTNFTTDQTNIPKDADGNIDPWQWDFVFPADYGGHPEFYLLKLTKKGRYFYKILKACGFDFASFPDVALTSANLQDVLDSANEEHNVYSLLAYCKIYCDFFLNAHFYNDDVLVNFLHHIHDRENHIVSGVSWYVASTGHVTTHGLFNLLNRVHVPHERNMYLDAFNQPNSPTGVSPDSRMISSNPDGLISPINPDFDFTFSNGVSYPSDSVLGSDVNASSFTQITASLNNSTLLNHLSQVGLNLLQGFYRFVKRNNLFGSKAVERVFARFGIKSDDFKSHYVRKLYEGSSPIDFSAVMSNADTNNKTLGAYAGFSVAGLNGEFSYKSSEFGYVIILSWLQMVPIKVRGVDPMVLRIKPQDWYTPEFDGQTIRAIPQCEISACKTGDSSVNGDKKIFGFTDLYDEYRQMRDVVLGDFVLDRNTRNFFFGRDYSYFRENTQRNSVVLKPQTNAVQYYDNENNPDCTNPFQYSYLVADRFFVQFNFDIKSSRSLLSKSAALDLNGVGELKLKLGGNN